MPLRMALEAMATRFELVADEGALPSSIRVAACEAALDALREVERTLSRFRRDALPARIERAAAADEEGADPSLRLTREEIVLLELCRRASARTDGAFDPALGGMPLRSWTIHRRERRVVPPRNASRIDLGGVAKGHALDLAVRALERAGVERALLHGGTSSVAALGAPPDAGAWRVRIRDPDDPELLIATVELRDRSLSVSATHGRTRADGGRHVVDPRDGRPVERVRLAAVVARHGAVAEIASTALLVLAERRLRHGLSPLDALDGAAPACLLAWSEGGRLRCATAGREAARFDLSPRTLAPATVESFA